MKLDWIQTIIGDSYTEEMDTAICKELGQRFVSKTDFNSKLEEIKGLNTQISDRDSQLDKLKKSVGNNEELNNQIQKLQDENKTAKEKHEKEINDLQFNHALEKALAGAKAKNTKAVQALLNMDELKLENGVIMGLEKQLDGIKKDNDYLFDAPESKPQFTTKQQSTGGESAIDARAIMGLPAK